MVILSVNFKVTQLWPTVQCIEKICDYCTCKITYKIAINQNLKPYHLIPLEYSKFICKYSKFI